MDLPCRTIQNTAFDSDDWMPKELRRLACFNANTDGGCCMALCSSRGYRCQRGAKYAVTIQNSKVEDKFCEKIQVTPEKFAVTRKQLKTSNESVLMLCTNHFNQMKKTSVWSAYITPVVGSAAWLLCTGAISAAASVGAGAAAEIALPVLQSAILGKAIKTTFQNVAGNATKKILDTKK